MFRVTPEGEWTQIAEYDGWPNGLKIHRDGRIFIADCKRGLMQLDPDSGAVGLSQNVRRDRNWRIFISRRWRRS